MQYWKAPANVARLPGCRRPGRLLAIQVHAKMKYKANIAQNHNRNAPGINVDYDRLYTLPSYDPSRQIGTIKLKPMPGRGRGLVADREVQLSEAVLLCEAVGPVLRAPLERELAPAHLVHALVQAEEGSRMAPVDRARLRLLYDGSPEDSPTSLRNRGASLTDFTKLEDKLRRANETLKKPKGKGFGAASPSSAAAGAAGTPSGAVAGSSIDMAALGAGSLTSDELIPLVAFNGWGGREDVAVAALRKEEPLAVLGLWPEYALLNHSCAPNTVAFPVGDRLLVQAVRDIPKGAEVTGSYLEVDRPSPSIMAPLERRREWLQRAYGFTCECERCQAESSVPPSVTAAVTAAFDLVRGSDRAASVFTEAVSRSDRGLLEPLEGELEAALERLEGSMEEAQLAEQLRTWLRCSAYPAFHFLARIRDSPDTRSTLFGGGGGGNSKLPYSDPEVPQSLLGLMEAVAPGSDPHLCLAVDAFSRAAMSYPRDDPRVTEATKAALRAHILRYGLVSDAILRSLVEVRSRLPHSLGEYPSVEVAERQGGRGGGAPSLPPLPGSFLEASAAQVRRTAEEVAGAFGAGV